MVCAGGRGVGGFFDVSGLCFIIISTCINEAEIRMTSLLFPMFCGFHGYKMSLDFRIISSKFCGGAYRSIARALGHLIGKSRK